MISWVHLFAHMQEYTNLRAPFSSWPGVISSGHLLSVSCRNDTAFTSQNKCVLSIGQSAS